MAPFGRIYSYLGNPRTTSALAVARMNTLDIELIYTQPREGVTTEYRNLNKLGRVPTFVGADGYLLTETIAINVYLASQHTSPKTPLLGRTKQDLASILRWMSFANSEVHPSGRQWFRPLLGIDPYDARKVETAICQTTRVLSILEDHLRDAGRSFLVGTGDGGADNTMTLADLFVAGILARQFDTVLDRNFRQEHIPRLTAWFERVADKPEFRAAYGGEVKLCDEGLRNEPPYEM